MKTIIYFSKTGMKKNVYAAMFCLSFSLGYSQMGINTQTPKTTLDVTGKGGVTDKDGLQAPRLTRADLTSKGDALYGADQKGALVYITDITGGDAVGPRALIDVVGYYYFDGTQWQKLSGGSGGSGVNLYNSDGTLASNRIVTQGDKTLAFTSSATSGTSHFSVDGSTLNVDAVNNRIGIGTTAPETKLDVVTTGASYGIQHSNGTVKLRTYARNTDGGWIGTYSNHPLRLMTNDGMRVHITQTGNVGIGNGAPTEKLDVSGNVKFSGALMPNNVAGTAGQVLTSNGAGNTPIWKEITTSGTVVGYSVLLSGNEVSWNGNNTYTDLDLSIGSGALANWRLNNSTLRVPAGQSGIYLLNFTSGVRVNGGVSSTYSFLTDIFINGVQQSNFRPITSVANSPGGTYANAIFSLSWSQIITLNAGDTILFKAKTFATSGTPSGMKMARVSLEKVN
ncbi:hypothetical protein [Chryseobacterium sp.]|uniref:hypothetical protein n=1 Tax=Chryseobacterium sp. TaxID=1871047 RepID=UPI0031D68393